MVLSALTFASKPIVTGYEISELGHWCPLSEVRAISLHPPFTNFGKSWAPASLLVLATLFHLKFPKGFAAGSAGTSNGRRRPAVASIGLTGRYRYARLFARFGRCEDERPEHLVFGIRSIARRNAHFCDTHLQHICPM